MVIVGNYAESPLPLLRVLCALCVEIQIPPSCNASEKCAPLSPFPATLIDPGKHKPFVCRSHRNTGGVTLPAKVFSSFFCILATCHELALSDFEVSLVSPEHSRRAANPRRIRTYEKRARNPFTIPTSKTQDLKPFRIRTYEKPPGEGASAGSFSSAPETDPQHPSVTLIGVPFWDVLVESRRD